MYDTGTQFGGLLQSIMASAPSVFLLYPEMPAWRLRHRLIFKQRPDHAAMGKCTAYDKYTNNDCHYCSQSHVFLLLKPAISVKAYLIRRKII